MIKVLFLFVYLCAAFGIYVEAATCNDDLGCSLNGICNGGSCKCDPQWIGDNCQLLNLKPAPAGKSNGYQEENTSSWGGSVVQVGSQYHMFASRISGGCGLNCWEGNSEIAHVVANSPLGPFTFQEIILPYFAHGPTIHQLSDGTFLLFHLGCSTPGHPMPDHNPCTCPWHNGTSPTEKFPVTSKIGSEKFPVISKIGSEKFPVTSKIGSEKFPVTSKKIGSEKSTVKIIPYACGSDYISLNTAPSVSGPWTTIGQKNPKVNWASGTTNPGIFMSANNSVFMAYRGNLKTDSANERLGVAYASSWKSEFVDTRSVPIFSHGGEDPFIYQDKRGNFHIIYHDMDGSDKGAHGYSRDGLTWYNGNVPCYTGEVHFDDGTSKKFQKRQRPQLIVEGGVPRYLYNGVMPGGITGDYSFTFAQEIYS